MIILTIFAVSTGAALGSLGNCLAYRIPRHLPVGNDRSRCPACGAQLRWFDNIPLFSYISLRGSCRYCRHTIPMRYLLAEIAGSIAGLIAAGMFLH